MRLQEEGRKVRPGADSGAGGQVWREFSLTTPRPEGRGFPFHRTQPMPQRDTGLTASPRTDAASPAANTLRAAFTSRSWIDPHSGHVHCRTFNGIFGIVYPQSEQRLDDGYHLSIPTSSRPYQLALYSNCRRNSDQLASAMDFDRQRFFCILPNAWFSRIISVNNRKEIAMAKAVKHLVQISIKQAAKILDVSESTLTFRMRKNNWSLQDALDAGPSMRKRVAVGDKYGHLTVEEVLPAVRGGNALVVARCSCGNTKEALALSLKDGSVCCCGKCNLGKELHGWSGTKTYESWQGMLARCGNQNRPDYRLYGGRGIKVCDAWQQSFTAFLRDMGERPDEMTLDRINPDGNYEAQNCRWASRETQSRNRRGYCGN